MNFVETLHDGQGLFGRIAVLFVRRTLKLGQIIRQRCFFGVLLDGDFSTLPIVLSSSETIFALLLCSLSRKDFLFHQCLLIRRVQRNLIVFLRNEA